MLPAPMNPSNVKPLTGVPWASAVYKYSSTRVLVESQKTTDDTRQPHVPTLTRQGPIKALVRHVALVFTGAARLKPFYQGCIKAVDRSEAYDSTN